MEKHFKTEDDLRTRFKEYVSYATANEEFMCFAGFAWFCGVGKDAIYQQSGIYPNAYKEIKAKLEQEAFQTPVIKDGLKAFLLKNAFGYKDKIEVKATIDVNMISRIGELSDEELLKLVEQLEGNSLIDDENIDDEDEQDD